MQIARRFIVVASLVLLVAVDAVAAGRGWRLAWSDDFDALDGAHWRLGEPAHPGEDVTGEADDEPNGAVTVVDGKLVIQPRRAVPDSIGNPVGQLVSARPQRYGRWEFRAQLLGGHGASSAISLTAADSRGDDAAQNYVIGIAAHRGDRPAITASTCRWGPRLPTDNMILVEQQTSRFGRPTIYAADFHVFAAEWIDDQIRFYVDDVHTGTLYPDEVGDFFSRPAPPLSLAFGAEDSGGRKAATNEASHVGRTLLVDWVRVYERAADAASIEFANGGFEDAGGSLAGWHAFGNRTAGDANIQVHNAAVLDGKAALKLSGQAPVPPAANYSGASQGISVAGGQRVRARLNVLSPPSAGIAGSKNRAMMKIEFYNNYGDYFGGPAMLGVEERLIADGNSPTDKWQQRDITATSPAGAVEARLSLVFEQPTNEPGAVFVDAVELSRLDESP